MSGVPWLVLAAGLAIAAPAPAQRLPPGGGDDGTASLDAYLDPVARRLIRGARTALGSSGPGSYTVRVHEQRTAEFVTGRRAHILQDLRWAARVRWAREEPPVARLEGQWVRHAGLSDSDSLAAWHLADPPHQNPFRFGLRQLAMLMGLDSAEMAAIVTPLDPGAERFYRYRSGDTVAVSLPGGETVRTVRVTAMPRFRSIRFLASTMWIEPERRGLARVAFRPAKPIDREWTFHLWDADGWNPGTDFNFGGDPAGVDSVGGAPEPGRDGTAARGLGRLLNAGLRGLLPRLEHPISSIVVDYSLWRSRWWLPRSMTLTMQTALIEEPGAWDWDEVPDVLIRVSSQTAFEVEEATEGDPIPSGQLVEHWQQAGDSGIAGDEGAVLIVPRERDAASPDELFLPAAWNPALNAPGGTLDDVASELARIEVGGGGGGGGRFGTPEAASEPSPWFFEPPLLTLRLMDYSAAEGVVAGTRLWRSYSWGRASLSASAGTRRTEPRVFLSFDARFPTARLRGAAYHDYRLTGVSGGADSTTSPGDPGWYAADGVQVLLSPARRNRRSVSLSLFAERHGEYGPASNRAGATAAWKPWWGGSGAARSRLLQGGALLSVRGTLEEDPSVRAAATATTLLFGSRRVSLGVEAGASRTWGGPRRTDQWLLDPGGRWFRGRTPRSFASRTAVRGRADLQLGVRFARLSVFGDWLRIFPEQPSAQGTTFFSAGVGIFLPGGLRIDLAREFPVSGSDAPVDAEWRPYFSIDTAF